MKRFAAALHFMDRATAEFVICLQLFKSAIQNLKLCVVPPNTQPYSCGFHKNMKGIVYICKD